MTPSLTGRPLEGRVALVTGAASGIGRAAALRLARDGAAVVLADCDAVGAATAATAIHADGGLATDLAIDVRNEESWAAVMNRVIGDNARLDIVVHAAGVAGFGSVMDGTLATWRETMAVNVDGTFLAMKFSLSAMRSAGRGSVITVGSMYGSKPMPGGAAYSASKAAVAMISRAAAIEARQAGLAIRVNCILPGWVKTPIWRGHVHWDELVRRCGGEDGAFKALATGISTKRFAEPDEIVGIIAFLASDDASHVTGTEIPVDGGLLGE